MLVLLFETSLELVLLLMAKNPADVVSYSSSTILEKQSPVDIHTLTNFQIEETPTVMHPLEWYHQSIECHSSSSNGPYG